PRLQRHAARPQRQQAHPRRRRARGRQSVPRLAPLGPEDRLMPAAPSRLKVRYQEEIRPQLVARFGYTSTMQIPRIEKITLNMGVGDAKQDSKALKAAQDQLATIAGQQPSIRRARKSIAAFKLR